jgi:hypothetical protein
MRKAGIIDGIGEKAFLQEIERKGFLVSIIGWTETFDGLSTCT